MSALIKRDGTWYLQVYDSTKRPTRKRVSLRTKRKREAERLQRKADKAYPDTWDPWRGDGLFTDLSLEGAKARFLKAKENKGCSSHTIRTYAMHLRGLLRVAGNRPVRSVSPREVEAFIHDQAVAPTTRRSRYRHMRAFFTWLLKRGHIDEPPLRIDEPKTARLMPKAISPQQLQVMEEEIQRDYEKKRAKGGVTGRQLLWTIPAFQIALFTGLRRSELVRLKWSDVKEDALLITEQKNQREELLPVLPKALEIIKEQPKIHNFVVGLSEKRRRLGHKLSLHFRTYRRKAGLPSHLSFHSLRHGYCTMLAEQGFTASEIKRLARHADVSTSMRYVHLDDDHLKRRLREV